MSETTIGKAIVKMLLNSAMAAHARTTLRFVHIVVVVYLPLHPTAPNSTKNRARQT